jgi:hypothetical protein
VAFAHVDEFASKKAELLDAANSKNVSSVTKPGTGFYCVSTSVPMKTVVGTADWNNGEALLVSANTSAVALYVALEICPKGTSVLVLTFNGKGEQKSGDFWLSFE